MLFLNEINYKTLFADVEKSIGFLQWSPTNNLLKRILNKPKYNANFENFVEVAITLGNGPSLKNNS